MVVWTASIALGAAAQLGKDRFLPWAMQVLQVISARVYVYNDQILIRYTCQYAISSIGKIIRYVPLHKVASNLSDIIPQWLNLLPINLNVDNEENDIVIYNLCSIIRLYINECFGQEYEHVDKIHQIIEYYITIKPQQKQLLSQTLTFIKDIIRSNWLNMSELKWYQLSHTLNIQS
ncbi:hypothetical protein DFA_00493 [Cavenderia fasciculata]|uniref:Uncharacterized protein n=1 Tax=Cavenderia fasciculata TaxID=261658 RepID=F4PS34_CACFS|nr:uncharacterized protein DFA_00493 [Cavenderia fasciculata]EGG20632.1 hypothetical protein DFA_00493 [Cavenderia fasciculata]|eukprot:XP_004358482.1 hypothetical protein DFA_00493 [Cavenderia fasciculata]